jgi:hypothetical protein
MIEKGCASLHFPCEQTGCPVPIGSTRLSRTMLAAAHRRNLSVVIFRPIPWSVLSLPRLRSRLTLNVESFSHPSERRYGFCSHLSHNAAAMHFHGGFAD